MQNNDTLHAQIQLLQWFKHFGSQLHSTEKIKRICVSFTGHLYEKPENAFYKVFLPLFSMGLIEFYGDNKYGVSPPVFLRFDDKIVGVNIPAETETRILKEAENGLKNKFGMLILNDATQYLDLLKTVKNSGIEQQKITGYSNFKSLPKLKSIITQNWILTEEPESAPEYYETNGWKNVKNREKAGIYKADEKVYANRYFFDGTENWYRVPSHQENPDASNLAIITGFILQGKDVGTYNKRTSDLTVSPYLPHLLKRLLYRNLQDKIDHNKELDFTRFTNVPHKLFTGLNSVLNGKIKIIKTP
jgi:hypothetical protein